DRLDGGDGFDQADYSQDGAVTIDLVRNIFSGAANGDQFISIEGVIGGFGNNVMKGNGADNTFSVTGGDSRLVGRSGNDTLLGASGADLLQGGSGNDTMNGGANNDRLLGNNGADTMNGSFGDDLLNAGNGNDVMTGGLGNDVFVFNGRNAGQDTITDFEDGRDVIRFKTALVDSFDDLAIAGNGSDHVTVVYGDQSIEIFGNNPITLTADDFAII
ncbi:MAG: hypothetical protein KDK75_10935, partial [Alphaproteobacteria bacterium]|nr:hypothetical protein [Alphaproteobacteria bacterium]